MIRLIAILVGLGFAGVALLALVFGLGPAFSTLAEHGKFVAPSAEYEFHEEAHAPEGGFSFAGPLGRWPGLARSNRLRGPLARSRLLNRIPLTPEGVPVKEAKEAISRLLDSGQKLFSLSFHTPTVVPGHTPYVRDGADLRAFWGWWDEVLDLFAAHGVLPARPADILLAATA